MLFARCCSVTWRGWALLVHLCFFSHISSGSDLTRLFVDSTQVALSEPAFFCPEFYAPEERNHELASVLVLQRQGEVNVGAF